MNNAKKPAYPPNAGWEHSEAKGLTKREVFAMAALQGILASRELQVALYRDVSQKLYPGQGGDTILAYEAVKQADELLKQLGNAD